MSDLDQAVLVCLPFLLLLPIWGAAHSGLSLNPYPNWCTKCARDSCPVTLWHKEPWADPYDMPLCLDELAELLWDWYGAQPVPRLKRWSPRRFGLAHGKRRVRRLTGLRLLQ